MYNEVNDYYDCDDVAFNILGHYSTDKYGALAMGFAIFNIAFLTHATVLFLDNELNFWMIEDEFKPVPQHYNMRLFLI